MNIVKVKQMNSIFLFMLTLSMSGVSCTPKNGITGTFTGLTNDTLLILTSVLNDEYNFEGRPMDTIVVRNGKFFYDPQKNNLTELTIIPCESVEWLPGGMITYGPGAKIVLLCFPSDHIRINVHYEDDCRFSSKREQLQ